MRDLGICQRLKWIKLPKNELPICNFFHCANTKADVFLDPRFKLLTPFWQFRIQHSLKDAVDGDDARFSSWLKQPHANQTTDQLRPRIAFTGGGIGGQFRMAL